MIVCLCHRVSDRSIQSEVRSGCDSFEALQDALCVGTACGACEPCARQTFDDACVHQARASSCVQMLGVGRSFPIHVVAQRAAVSLATA